jgi:hypothetical protein
VYWRRESGSRNWGNNAPLYVSIDTSDSEEWDKNASSIRIITCYITTQIRLTVYDVNLYIHMMGIVTIPE